MRKLREATNRKKLIYSEVVLFFISFMFFVFAPYEIYLASKEDFFFEGYEMLAVMGLGFCTSFGILSVMNLLCIMISPKLHKLFFAISFSCGLAFYIQGNYIQADYGMLDGNAINWSDYHVEGLISHGLFILLIVTGLLLLKKLKDETYMKVGSGVAIGIILVQIVTLLTLFIQVGGLGKTPVYVATTEGEFSYSQNGNMFVFVMDTFDAKVMDDLLQCEEADRCKQVLEDFTFYPDTLGLYSNTKFSIPYILSGIHAQEYDTYDEYVSAAFQQNDFFRILDEKEWDCRMYSDTQLPDISQEISFDNINEYKLKVSSKRSLGSYMLKLVGFRYMPQCLKEYFWFYSDDMKSMIEINAEEEIFYWSNADFYRGTDNIDSNNENGVYCFYHLEGTHVPFYTQENMSELNEEVGINEEGLAMMTLIEKFTTKLKESGIYDNSVIVIMADHGYYENRQNPVFMVKGIGEEHSFTVSDGRVSYENMQETFINLIEGIPSQNAVVTAGNSDRIYYDIDEDELSEMSLTGVASEASDMEYTGNVYFIE